MNMKYNQKAEDMGLRFNAQQNNSKFCLLSLTCAIGAVVLSAELLADDLPQLTPDPTKAQQPMTPPSWNKDTKTESLQLPKILPGSELTPAGDTIVLNQILFEGSSVFTDAELQAVVTSYLHRPIRASDIESIRRTVSQYYIDQG